MPVEVGDNKYVVEEIHCRFLARESDGRYACTVYENRFEMAPWCHTAEEALASGHLATDCPYTSHDPNYKGRVWAPPAVRDKLMPIIRKKLIADGLPLCCSPDSALKVLTSSGDDWSYTEQKDGFLFYRKA